eukprot:TRINITY_DN1047_c0_g1_i1.p2 TRINITY_DN1047_c0_g1~~TRINITY_DN1047_c0_g1_i1.p2  ORF type:complete len:119 (+),score=14.45 TRINITY_DN1047_c0_g1_i1:96-452(+)
MNKQSSPNKDESSQTQVKPEGDHSECEPESACSPSNSEDQKELMEKNDKASLGQISIDVFNERELKKEPGDLSHDNDMLEKLLFTVGKYCKIDPAYMKSIASTKSIIPYKPFRCSSNK